MHEQARMDAQFMDAEMHIIKDFNATRSNTPGVDDNKIYNSSDSLTIEVQSPSHLVFLFII